MTERGMAVCEDCGLAYDVNIYGLPETEEPYTCDDCGGYVDEVNHDG